MLEHLKQSLPPAKAYDKVLYGRKKTRNESTKYFMLEHLKQSLSPAKARLGDP